MFDRTETLYQPDPNNASGPYQIKEAYKTMLKQLINAKYRIYILSGHGTARHKKHVENRAVKPIVKR